MITYMTKDDVLKCLCENCTVENHLSLDTSVLLKTTQKDFDAVNAVLIYFQRIGFLKDLNSRHEVIYLTLLVEANDFYLRGGFVAQEELLQNNIRKLLLEIEQLKPSFPEKVERITNIGNAILSAIGLFIKY